MPYLTADNVFEVEAKNKEPLRPLGVLLIQIGEMAFISLGVVSYGNLMGDGFIVAGPDGSLIERSRDDESTGARDLYNIILAWCTGLKRRMKNHGV